MTEMEARIQALRQRLAQENRCLLFMLRQGYTLREAERILRVTNDDESRLADGNACLNSPVTAKASFGMRLI